MEHKKYPYPLTIVNDEYSGTYSGGRFTAWNRYADCLPYEIDCSDVTVWRYWDEYRRYYDRLTNSYDIVGLGETPDAAVDDLIRRCNEKGIKIILL